MNRVLAKKRIIGVGLLASLASIGATIFSVERVGTARHLTNAVSPESIALDIKRESIRKFVETFKKELAELRERYPIDQRSNDDATLANFKHLNEVSDYDQRLAELKEQADKLNIGERINAGTLSQEDLAKFESIMNERRKIIKLLTDRLAETL